MGLRDDSEWTDSTGQGDIFCLSSHEIHTCPGRPGTERAEAAASALWVISRMITKAAWRGHGCVIFQLGIHDSPWHVSLPPCP